ncbi:hypothetical protein [Novacetimonas cocois]|uniref:hypothetical protein n=1 Tax=Novacetimonas cocois TaxID=1747507 RepID=UPI001057E4BB|nr:hypothetical protein [Novacetimonas cocois]
MPAVPASFRIMGSGSSFSLPSLVLGPVGRAPRDVHVNMRAAHPGRMHTDTSTHIAYHADAFNRKNNILM